MSDYTEVESQLNETKAKNIHSRARVAEAEADEKQAQAQKDEAEAKAIKAKGKKQRARMKNAAITVGLVALVAGGAWIGYKSRKGVKDVMDGTAEVVNETGRAVKTVARVTKATNDFVEDATTDPDLAGYLIKAQNQRPNFLRPEKLLRAGQANAWTGRHPDFPITKEQLEILLKQNEEFMKEKGRYMNNQEVMAARAKLIKKSPLSRLKKGSKEGGPQPQRQNGGR